MKPDLFLKSTIAVITATAEARVRSDGSIETETRRYSIHQPRY